MDSNRAVEVGTSCRYSFDDLFFAVNGRVMTETEREQLFSLPQPKRNNIVRRWANQAGWQTENRVGSDKNLYTAFWP